MKISLQNRPDLARSKWDIYTPVHCILNWSYNRIKSVNTILKGTNEFFFAKSSKFGKVQMGHLHTRPLHLKLMPTTSLSHTLHHEETTDNTFDYIFHSQLKKLLLNFSDYLIWNCSQSVVICHVHLCIIINHSLSLYHCREHKATFQIVSNWWLKY